MSAYPHKKDATPVTLQAIWDRVGNTTYAVLGILLGVVSWLFGAHYTVTGAVLGAERLSTFLVVPVAIPEPAWQWWYIALWILPVLCSIAEMRKARGHTQRAVWLILVIIDLGTTFLGLGLPEDYQARHIIWCATLTLFLTFFPEWLMKTSWRGLRG